MTLTLRDAYADCEQSIFYVLLLQVERAARDGYDVRGLFFWTLLDNFEWDSAYKQYFGLFAWHPDGSQRRTMRKGTAAIADLFKRLPGNIQAARQQATIQTPSQPWHAAGDN